MRLELVLAIEISFEIVFKLIAFTELDLSLFILSSLIFLRSLILELDLLSELFFGKPNNFTLLLLVQLNVKFL